MMYFLKILKFPSFPQRTILCVWKNQKLWGPLAEPISLLGDWLYLLTGANSFKNKKQKTNDSGLSNGRYHLIHWQTERSCPLLNPSWTKQQWAENKHHTRSPPFRSELACAAALIALISTMSAGRQAERAACLTSWQRYKPGWNVLCDSVTLTVKGWLILTVTNKKGS